MSLTSTISNTIKDLNGTAIAGVSVDIILKPQGAFRIDDNTEIAPKETVVTDTNGTWSINLERTSNISPANSYYSVTEKIPVANGGPATWAIQVGAGNALLQASLVTPPPSTSASLYLSQVAADARYQQIGTGTLPTSINPNVAASAGVSALGSRVDHQHEQTALSRRSLLIDSSITEVEVANTTVESTLLTCTLPANILVAGDSVDIIAPGLITNDTGTNVTFQFSVRFGGTLIAQTGSSSLGFGISPRSFMFRCSLFSLSTISQRIFGELWVSSVTSTTWDDLDETLTLQALFNRSGAEDTTLSKDLTLTIIMGFADVNAKVSISAFSAKLLKAA